MAVLPVSVRGFGAIHARYYLACRLVQWLLAGTRRWPTPGLLLGLTSGFSGCYKLSCVARTMPLRRSLAVVHGLDPPTLCAVSTLPTTITKHLSCRHRLFISIEAISSCRSIVCWPRPRRGDTSTRRQGAVSPVWQPQFVQPNEVAACYVPSLSNYCSHFLLVSIGEIQLTQLVRELIGLSGNYCICGNAGLQ